MTNGTMIFTTKAILRLTLCAAVLLPSTSGFLPSFPSPNALVLPSSNRRTQRKASPQGGEVGKGPNWIERSFPVDTDDSIDAKTVIDYDLGISGVNLQTGELSRRMFEVIEAKSSLIKGASLEVKKGFLIYTMDFTAKEAVKAALKQNGLELALTDDEQDEGMWSDIDSIKLLDEEGTPIPGEIFDSWEEAVENWAPGQAFDFVARQVPAKMRELSLDELLQALDPNGELRDQAKDAGMTLPDEGINSLNDMANENVRRTEMSPREVDSDDESFAGEPEKRGYQPINVSDLTKSNMEADGSEKEAVLMHVMDGLVNHGCLIVDLTDSGKSFEKSKIVAQMWDTVKHFYEDTTVDERVKQIPAMKTLEEVGSPHAKAGFASYQDGDMQFFETRLDREGKLFPEEAQSILGPNGCQTLSDSFQIVADLGKDIVRVVVGASTREMGLLAGPEASKASQLVANELLDDGKAIQTDIETEEGRVSMSPHRICLYSNSNKQEKDGEKAEDERKEIFGAHTDSTFITAVPVAAVAGLDVFDEDAGEWYRPEIASRNAWQAERLSLGLDPQATVEEVDGVELPWHSRYIVVMAGELLQLCSRNEVMATVHRVVAAKDAPSRLSAP